MIYDFLSRHGPVTNTQNGQTTDIKNLQFKYLGLYFTAVWCSSCVRTADSLKNTIAKINQAHPDLFKMITIRLDESNENLGYSYWRFPQLTFHAADQLSKNLAVRYLPSIYVFNTAGYLVSANGLKEIFEHREKVISFWDRIPQ